MVGYVPNIQDRATALVNPATNFIVIVVAFFFLFLKLMLMLLFSITVEVP
jgi:hypothetical protein